MSLTRAIATFVLGILAALGTACDRTPHPDTPADFVKAMRDAYLRKDVDAIMALTADPRVVAGGGLRREQREAIERHDRDRDRAELERECQSEGMWFRAWTTTQFVSSRQHRDHIHVTVAVQHVPSQLVLVPQGGSLKLHPRPGLFD